MARKRKQGKRMLFPQPMKKGKRRSKSMTNLADVLRNK